VPRLDKVLKEAHPDLSWRQIREAIAKGQVSVDGQVQRDEAFETGAAATAEINRNRPAQSRARANFDILHEDEHIIVLNKPAGLLSIPSSPDAGSSEDTVLKRVREYMAFKLGHKSYVGMLHRLDRDTSGSLAVALSKDAHAAGREMFKRHAFERHYLAIVQGIPNLPQGTIEAKISTGYRVKQRLKNAALLELRLHTGRQHQIRLHLEQLGHPLLGERIYADGDARQSRVGRTRVEAKRNMLHAWTLAFAHPLTGAPIAVEAPLPEDFQQVLARLGG
jgi:23S rRNA pseudouridine1911/1915/1917 synthase